MIFFGGVKTELRISVFERVIYSVIFVSKQIEIFHWFSQSDLSKPHRDIDLLQYCNQMWLIRIARKRISSSLNEDDIQIKICNLLSCDEMFHVSDCLKCLLNQLIKFDINYFYCLLIILIFSRIKSKKNYYYHNVPDSFMA